MALIFTAVDPLDRLVARIVSECDPSNWDSGDLPDGTRYKGESFRVASEIYEKFLEIALDHQAERDGT